MLKLTYCLHRLPSLSREEFQHYWRGTHAPLVKAAAPHLGIERYVQSHTEEHAVVAATAAGRGIPVGDGEEYDGVAELWFADDAFDGEPTAEAANHSRILAEDEAKFIDFARSRIFITRENVVVG
ncbi:EthD domain-containing protein [Parerythrobacter aestuarii]|uniref:EthD domain-containing protein n=1 Tax=Parerythrobacter aestuarii TaxID=3020909 RepID=UPI0024DE1AC7|nr:EthD domain-containing protein [Parerythrobacter aestuarii]